MNIKSLFLPILTALLLATTTVEANDRDVRMAPMPETLFVCNAMGEVVGDKVEGVMGCKYTKYLDTPKGRKECSELKMTPLEEEALYNMVAMNYGIPFADRVRNSVETKCGTGDEELRFFNDDKSQPL